MVTWSLRIRAFSNTEQSSKASLLFNLSEFDLAWECSGKGRGRFTLLVWQIASATGLKKNAAADDAMSVLAEELVRAAVLPLAGIRRSGPLGRK
jgi:hypothetical protein